jgi:hypothetical protein
MTNPNPDARAFNGPHKRLWYLGSVVAVVLGLLIAVGGGDADLNLDMKRANLIDALNDGKALYVTNTGTQPLTITKLTINGRQDCRVAGPTFPIELKVGERSLMSSNCRIIRVEVNSNRGSESYEFGG